MQVSLKLEIESPTGALPYEEHGVVGACIFMVMSVRQREKANKEPEQRELIVLAVWCMSPWSG